MNNKLLRRSLISLFSIALTTPITQTYSLASTSDQILNVIDETSEIKNQYNSNDSIGKSYILGEGDVIRLYIKGVNEYSGIYDITSGGTTYLPELGEIYAEGLTLNELRRDLIIKYEEFLVDPNIYISLYDSRPVKVYITGEVKRPGYYILSDVKASSSFSGLEPKLKENTYFFPSSEKLNLRKVGIPQITLFDALKASQGITPYSDLKNVSITRKTSRLKGSKTLRTNVDFLSVFLEGDQSQNIRIYDGDIIKVSKTDEVLRDQVMQAAKTNISPDYIKVFVTGNVSNIGPVTIPQGSGLNQAIAMAGGPKIFSGKVEFLRFNSSDKVDRRLIRFNNLNTENDIQNPILMSGDIINVRRSLLGNAKLVVDEISRPALGIYSLYNIYDKVTD